MLIEYGRASYVSQRKLLDGVEKLRAALGVGDRGAAMLRNCVKRQSRHGSFWGSKSSSIVDVVAAVRGFAVELFSE